MKIDLETKIGKINLKNPIMVASGTFGYAEEFKDFIDLKGLGAIITKTITLKPRQGNPPPRTCQTYMGMLNAIGLENPGIDVFIEKKLPLCKNIGIPIIASIASEENPEEFISLSRRLDKIKEIAGLELNISCPNVRDKKNKTGRLGLISQDPKATYELVKMVRKVTNKTIITKLSPNVTDITDIAKAAEEAGSDAVSLVNTFLGLAIDIDTRQPKLGNITGGLSGPAIKPIAVRMVWEVSRFVNIPIIGIGGIMTKGDALEYIIAGATAVQVGTANFINPDAAITIIEGLTKYLKKNKISNIKNIRGSLII